MIIGLFAVDDIGSIGYNGRLPWPKNRDDLMWFKKTTEGQIVAMGRSTWDSPDMPSPLPNRLNIIFTNNVFECDGVVKITGSVPDALEAIQEQYPENDIYVIGGLSVLEQAKPVLNKLLVTKIPGEYTNDVALNLKEFTQAYTLTSIKKLSTCSVEIFIREEMDY